MKCLQRACLFLILIVFFGTSLHAQDIESGTGVVVAPPRNPTVRRRVVPRVVPVRQQTQPRRVGAPDGNTTARVDATKNTSIPNNTTTQPEQTARVNENVTTPETTTTTTTEPAAPTVADQVEDAIEQGNNARDARPPRYAEAERAYKKAAELNPNDARAYAGLGNVYFDQRMFPDAETNFQQATQLNNTDAEAFRYLAFTCIKTRKFPEAEAAARRAIELDPKDFYAYSAFGWSEFRLKKFPEAESAYRKAIELSPQTFGLYSDLGLFLAKQGRYQDALEPYRKALELNPTYAPALANYGVVQQKLWQLDGAADAFTRFLKINDKAAQVHSNLGLIYYHKGDTARAAAEWEAAQRLGSMSPLDRAGLNLLHRQYPDARPLLEAYVRGNPNDENGWLMLGDMITATGDKKLARKAYDNAAKVSPLVANISRPKI